MTYTLSMSFLTETGEKSTFSISGVKADVSQEEVTTLMDAIIENKIFRNKKGDFMTKEGATLNQRESTKFEI